MKAGLDVIAPTATELLPGLFVDHSEPSGDLPQALFIASHHRDPRAARDQGFDHGQPQPPIATNDDCLLSLQLMHRIRSFLCTTIDGSERMRVDERIFPTPRDAARNALRLPSDRSLGVGSRANPKPTQAWPDRQSRCRGPSGPPRPNRPVSPNARRTRPNPS